jgi:hypothetical protein
MTDREAIDSLRVRITRAEADRDMWRVAGIEERYMESYFMVEALELQMDQHLQALAQLAPAPLRLPERSGAAEPSPRSNARAAGMAGTD